MTTEEARNYGFTNRMNKGTRTPFFDKKFFDRVCKEKPDEGNDNAPWAELFDSWVKGWEEADEEYKKSTKK